MAKHLLHTLIQKDGNGIRYLLTNSIDGNRAVALIEMADGIETEIARGTRHEMDEKAWEHIAAGKFSVVKEDGPPVFDSLKNTGGVGDSLRAHDYFRPETKEISKHGWRSTAR